MLLWLLVSCSTSSSGGAGGAGAGSASKLSNVHTVFWRNGVGVMAAVQAQQRGQKDARTWGQDVVVGIAHDPLVRGRSAGSGKVGIGRNMLAMRESVNVLNVDQHGLVVDVGKVHAVTEAPPPEVLTRVELYTLSGARCGLDFLATGARPSVAGCM